MRVKSPQAFQWRNAGLPISAICARHFSKVDSQFSSGARDAMVVAIQNRAGPDSNAPVALAFRTPPPHAYTRKLSTRSSELVRAVPPSGARTSVARVPHG